MSRFGRSYVIVPHVIRKTSTSNPVAAPAGSLTITGGGVGAGRAAATGAAAVSITGGAVGIFPLPAAAGGTATITGAAAAVQTAAASAGASLNIDGEGVGLARILPANPILSYVDRRDTLNRLARVSITGAEALGWLMYLDALQVRAIADEDLAAMVGGIFQPPTSGPGSGAYGDSTYGDGYYGG